MTDAETQENLDDGYARHTLLYKIAVAILFGIPMTIALGIALSVYCVVEYIKFALAQHRHGDLLSAVRRR